MSQSNQNTPTVSKSGGSPASGEVILYGYDDPYRINVKVYCNEQYIGLLNKNDQMSIPITNDSTIKIDGGVFVSDQITIPIKAGQRSQFQLAIKRNRTNQV